MFLFYFIYIKYYSLYVGITGKAWSYEATGGYIYHGGGTTVYGQRWNVGDRYLFFIYFFIIFLFIFVNLNKK